MKNGISRILAGGVLVLAALCVLSACGGGGGTSSGGGGMTYTGATQKAPVTNSTSKAILSDLYSDASSGNNLVGVSSQNGGSNNQRGPVLMLIAKDLSDAAGQITAGSDATRLVQKTTQSSSATIYGPCGGSATVAATVDTSNYTFTGTATFSNYCGLGITVNGSGNYTGSVNSQNLLLQQFSFSTNGLTADSGAQSLTMSGSIDYSSLTWDANNDMTGFTATENLYVDNAGNVYWADNVTLGVAFKYASGSLSEIDTTIAGAFYDPSYGYVTASTPVAFVFYSPWDYPSAGELTAVGANNSSALLSVPSHGYADIKVDADGCQ